jgi:hypothetical protein
MRRTGLLALTLYGSLYLASFVTRVEQPVSCQTPAGCPVNTGRHWPKGKVVKYRLDGLNATSLISASTAKDLARQAFGNWSLANQANDSNVTFQEAQPGEAAQITVNTATSRIMSGTRDVKAEVAIVPDSSSGGISSAIIRIDLNNEGHPRLSECGGAPPEGLSCQFFDPFAPNLETAIIRSIMHEIGHTMGLENVTGGPVGLSLMGGAYSPNDCVRFSVGAPCISARPAGGQFPSPCDIAAINGVYAPAPTPPPGGGGPGPEPPPPPPPDPPGYIDGDGDGYYAWPYGSDCNDFSWYIHPNMTHEEKCETYYGIFGGQVSDVDCDGWDDYDECVSTGGRMLDPWLDYEGSPPGGETFASGHTLSLQSWSGLYVVAEGGGGGDVNANRSVASTWETFTLVDINGGVLNDGDSIGLQTVSGLYLQAVNTGNGIMAASGQGLWSWETFIVLNLDRPGDVIRPEDQIALMSLSNYYVCAEGGGGAEVNVNRTAIGPWETFRIRRQ